MNPLRCMLAALTAGSLALGLLGAAAHADGGPTFALQPVTYDPEIPATRSYFIFDTAPGQTVHSAVKVTNAGTAAGSVRLYAVDATTGQTGGTVYLGREAPREDAGAWVTLDADTFTLAPGEARVVPFTVQVPSTVRPGQHIAGIVAENLTLTQGGTGPLQVNVQNLTITAIQLNLPGEPIEQLQVTDIRADGQNGYQTLLLHLKNSGTTLLKPAIRVTVVDAQGQPVQDQQLQLDTVLPQTAIDYPVLVQHTALTPGTYTARVELAYGTSRHDQLTLPFSVSAAQVQQVFAGQAPLTAPPQAQRSAAGAASGHRLPLLPLAGMALALALIFALGVGLYGRRRHTA